MNLPKTQLLTDWFEYTKPSKAKRTKTRHPKTAPRRPRKARTSARTAKDPKPRLTDEQKQERRRKKAAEKRQCRKAQGLYRSGQAAKPGQTRCPACAEKHRVWTTANSEKRRRAKGIKPRSRIDDAELEQIRKEIATRDQATARTPTRVRSEEYKQKLTE